MDNVSSNNNDLMHVSPKFDISVVSDNVCNFTGWVTHLGLSKSELETAHWLVMENCVEVQPYMNGHKWLFETQCPNGDLAGRIESFNYMFRKKMNALGTQAQRELKILSLKPLATRSYLQCTVNGVKWVSEERDHKRTTQNSGVMVMTNDMTYYGILVQVVELLYEQGMSVELFRCRWYDETTIKMDRGLISVDTNNDCYKCDPFCLALHARQVFYIDDPVKGDGWKVVNHMFHRGMYNERTLARNTNVGPVYDVEEPYQEPVTIPICNIFIDLGPIPFINIPSDEDEGGEDYNPEEDEDEFEDGYSDVDNINNEIYDSDNDDNDDNGNNDFDPEY